MDRERYKKLNESSKCIKDALGMPIDRNIRKLIVLLNYHRIITTASCWGHNNWGLSYPWVDVNLNMMNRANRIKLKKLISEFRLEVFKFDNKGEIRIQPIKKNLFDGRKQFNKLKYKLIELTK